MHVVGGSTAEWEGRNLWLVLTCCIYSRICLTNVYWAPPRTWPGPKSWGSVREWEQVSTQGAHLRAVLFKDRLLTFPAHGGGGLKYNKNKLLAK